MFFFPSLGVFPRFFLAFSMSPSLSALPGRRLEDVSPPLPGRAADEPRGGLGQDAADQRVALHDHEAGEDHREPWKEGEVVFTVLVWKLFFFFFITPSFC